MRGGFRKILDLSNYHLNLKEIAMMIDFELITEPTRVTITLATVYDMSAEQFRKVVDCPTTSTERQLYNIIMKYCPDTKTHCRSKQSIVNTLADINRKQCTENGCTPVMPE